MPKKWIKKIAAWLVDPFSIFKTSGEARKRKTSRKQKSKTVRAAKKKSVRPGPKKAVKKTVRKIRPAKRKPPRKALKKTLPSKAAVNPSRKAQAGKNKKIVPAKKKAVLKTQIHKAVQPAVNGVYIGEITHYFSKAKACAMTVSGAEIKMGDKIHIRGKNTDLKMTVVSLQISRIPVDSGRPGEEVGLGVKKDVQPGDKVYKI